MPNFENTPSFMERLEELREARGISKKDMALRAGISPGYISLLTRGTRIAPSKEVVHDLAEALELDVKERIELFESAGYDASTAYLFSGKQRDQLVSRDWGEAPRIQLFRGRENEVEQLQRWIVADGCQLISIVGIGGVGKTLLATYVAEKGVQNDFDYILWRSLQNAPSIEKILKDCIHLFSGRQSKALTAFADLVDDVDGQIALLIDYLQEHRCLIILDNFESVLRVGSRSGNYRVGYEKYGMLLQRIGEVKHNSCLLLTSREKPKEMLRIEGKDSHVRSMLLNGLEQEDARIILQEKELQGTDAEWKQLIDLYSGNPLALKLVAESIRALFGGVIRSFLRTGESVFGDIHNLLDEQFSRLSELERDIMYWVAIEREEVSLDELEKELVRPVPKRELLEAVEALLRRSMIETHRAATYTLQQVIMEYLTDRFVEQIYREIYDENVATGLFSSHALMKAQAKDYIRDFQTDLILKPIATQLLDNFERSGSEKKLKRILESLRENPYSRSYAAGNILNLLVYLNVDLQRYDFSRLPVRQAYLQGVSLRDVNFADADLSESVFTDTFGSIFSVALSANGRLLAAGTANGEIRLWNTTTASPMPPLQGHTEWVRSVAFSPDQQYLASGSEDQTVRLWDIHTGRCLSILRGHTSRVYSVAYSPDGKSVVSGSDDKTIRIWDVETGECLNVLQGHRWRIYSVAFHPNGDMIASGSGDNTVRLWNAHTGECLSILLGHTNRVRSVAFSLDGTMLASGSGDQTVRLWDACTGESLRVLQGHTNWVWSVAFSPDSACIASGSDDQTIRVWNVATGQCQRILHRYEKAEQYGNRVYSVAFSADGDVIASGCDGQTVRLWDASKGECLKTLQGHGSRVYSVTFSPDGETIASGCEDKTVRLWEIHSGDCFKTLQAHSHWVWSVAFSPDSNMLASGSENKTLRLWNARTGELLNTLTGHENRIYSVAFSPNGKLVASSSGDQTVKLWDMKTGECLKTFTGHESRVYSVAFSPDGTMLVSGSDDQTIKLWDIGTGACLKTFGGHAGRVRSVAFSPDGNTIADGSEDATIKIWDVKTGECLKTLQGHTSWVWSVAFSPDVNMIASGSEDATIKLWDINRGECQRTLRGHDGTVYSVVFHPTEPIIASGSHDGVIKLWNWHTGENLRTLRSDRPYERMSINGARGLTFGQRSILRALGAIED